jgi:hypothetical protein
VSTNIIEDIKNLPEFSGKFFKLKNNNYLLYQQRTDDLPLTHSHLTPVGPSKSDSGLPTRQVPLVVSSCVAGHFA